MKRSGLLSDRELILTKTKIDILVQASYFNHKSHGEEMLIERYQICLLMEQRTPKTAMVTKVHSTEIFNLNLTYGCILSLIKVLQFIKDSEREKEEEEESQQEAVVLNLNKADVLLYGQLREALYEDVAAGDESK